MDAHLQPPLELPQELGSGGHIVALPYPGRGHINPMMNLCRLLTTRDPNLHITFVLTEEWLGLIRSEPKPDNVRFATIPNVIPSEKVRAECFLEFLDAVMTKMEGPFERLLDGLQGPVVDAIVADTYLSWAVRVGNRRRIHVASLWTMSASVFTVFHHFSLLVEKNHFPLDLSKSADTLVDYIPGLPPTRADELTTFFDNKGLVSVDSARDSFVWVSRAQCLLFTTIHELEASVIDALKTEFSFPVYTIGPLISFMPIQSRLSPTADDALDYVRWLDSQPTASVLYVSLGSFLSVSAEQMREVVAGVHKSGVRFLCVSRGDDFWTKDGNGGGDRGVLVPWCDQLRVLSHPSVGGFWTHCGFNSTLEAIYSGVPMLAFPIWWDQVPNAKQIEQDWKVGWRVKKRADDPVVHRDRIAEHVRRFMDPEDETAGKKIRTRARQLREACLSAIQEGGSSRRDLDAFYENSLTRN